MIVKGEGETQESHWIHLLWLIRKLGSVMSVRNKCFAASEVPNTYSGIFRAWSYYKVVKRIPLNVQNVPFVPTDARVMRVEFSCLKREIEYQNCDVSNEQMKTKLDFLGHNQPSRPHLNTLSHPLPSVRKIFYSYSTTTATTWFWIVFTFAKAWEQKHPRVYIRSPLQRRAESKMYQALIFCRNIGPVWKFLHCVQ